MLVELTAERLHFHSVYLLVVLGSCLSLVFFHSLLKSQASLQQCGNFPLQRLVAILSSRSLIDLSISVAGQSIHWHTVIFVPHF